MSKKRPTIHANWRVILARQRNEVNRIYVGISLKLNRGIPCVCDSGLPSAMVLLMVLPTSQNPKILGVLRRGSLARWAGWAAPPAPPSALHGAATVALDTPPARATVRSTMGTRRSRLAPSTGGPPHPDTVMPGLSVSCTLLAYASSGGVTRAGRRGSPGC